MNAPPTDKAGGAEHEKPLTNPNPRRGRPMEDKSMTQNGDGAKPSSEPVTGTTSGGNQNNVINVDFDRSPGQILTGREATETFLALLSGGDEDMYHWRRLDDRQKGAHTNLSGSLDAVYRELMKSSTNHSVAPFLVVNRGGQHKSVTTQHTASQLLKQYQRAFRHQSGGSGRAGQMDCNRFPGKGQHRARVY